MSNRIKLKTDMQDKLVLSEALTALGVKHEVCEENASIVDYWNKEVTKQASIKVSKYVGFAFNDDNKLEMVGDTHYENGLLAKSDAVKKVQQVYQAVNVYKTLQESGYQAEADLSNCATADEIHVTADISLE